MVAATVLYGDLAHEVMVAEFITFGANKVCVFQVMAQIQMGQKLGQSDFVKFGPYVENCDYKRACVGFF